MLRFVAPVAQRLRRCRKTACETASQPAAPEHDFSSDCHPQQCIATALRNVLQETSETAEQKLLQMFGQREGELMDEIWILHKQCAALVDENCCLRKVLGELDGNNGYGLDSHSAKISTVSLSPPLQASAAEGGRALWECNRQEFITPKLLQECPLDHDFDGEVVSATSADMDVQWSPCPADEEYIALAAADAETAENVLLQAKLPPINWCDPLTTVPPRLTQPEIYNDSIHSAGQMSSSPSVAGEMLEQPKDVTPHPPKGLDAVPSIANSIPTTEQPQLKTRKSFENFMSPSFSAMEMDGKKEKKCFDAKPCPEGQRRMFLSGREKYFGENCKHETEIRCGTRKKSGIFLSSIGRSRYKEVKAQHEEDTERLQCHSYENQCTIRNDNSESFSESLDDDCLDTSRSGSLECNVAQL